MADVSNKKLLIPLGTFLDMEKRVKAYLNSSQQNTLNKVFIVKNGKDYVSYNKFKEMKKRVSEFKKNNPKKPLKNVWIVKPATTVNIIKPPASTNIVPTVNIKGKKYQPATFSIFYGLMGGFGYSYYNNDILTLNQEINKLSNGKAMNCTDLAQLGVYISSQYKKDGKSIYKTRYAHINCKSGGGHTTFQIKGGEFKNWTMIDLAAKADKNSRTYPIGDYWCRDGKIRGYNELWVMSDDGR
ncbi:MAG: hypothetical protein LBU40_00300 [Methanobrevibacter sp.]|jgi:hypothetical protein|nr:hypothetical protein [Methanobrevibacter sp.]